MKKTSSLTLFASVLECASHTTVVSAPQTENSFKFANFTKFLEFVKIRFLSITRHHKSFRVCATLTQNSCPSELQKYIAVTGGTLVSNGWRNVKNKPLIINKNKHQRRTT